MKKQATLTLVILTMTLITATLLAPFAFAENSKRRLVTIHPHGSIDTIPRGSGPGSEVYGLVGAGKSRPSG